MKIELMLICGVGALLAPALQADVLKLKDGPALRGTLISANSRELSFLSTEGAAKTYPIDAIAGIDFAPLPVAGAMTIAAGTQLAVRTIDAIDGSTAKPGARYRASIDDPVMVGSQVTIPRGANCTLEVVALREGEELVLRLRDVNVAGKLYSTSTEYAEVEATGTSKAQKGVKRGIGLGAVGAGVGAIAGGGKGAAVGGAIGAGVGAASSARAKGKQINVPSEARLVLTLTAPLLMN